MASLKKPKSQIGKHTGSHARAPKQERAIARRVGGDTVRGSGSGSEKGDVRKRGIVRIECKTTKNKSFSVTREMMEKIEQAALPHDEIPAIVIEFNDGAAPVSSVVGTLCVVPLYVLNDLATEKENRNAT